MQLPNSEHAWVPREKITGYLLVERHKQGGSKADRFIRYGFSVDRWELLAQALIVHGINNEVINAESTEYGVKYVIEGDIETPIGIPLYVRSIWQIDRGTESPRLVTAYPIGR